MEKLSAKALNEYLWEALQDYKEGNLSRAELNAAVNAAGKMVQVAMIDLMSSKNALGKNDVKEVGKSIK